MPRTAVLPLIALCAVGAAVLTGTGVASAAPDPSSTELTASTTAEPPLPPTKDVTFTVTSKAGFTGTSTTLTRTPGECLDINTIPNYSRDFPLGLVSLESDGPITMDLLPNCGNKGISDLTGGATVWPGGRNPNLQDLFPESGNGAEITANARNANSIYVGDERKPLPVISHPRATSPVPSGPPSGGTIGRVPKSGPQGGGVVGSTPQPTSEGGDVSGRHAPTKPGK